MEIPPDIFRLIAIHLHYNDIVAYSLAIPFFPDRIFWIDKAQHDFQVSYQYITSYTDIEESSELYIKIAAYMGHPLIGIDKYVRNNRDSCQLIWKSARAGNLSLANKLLIELETRDDNKIATTLGRMVFNIGAILSGKSFTREDNITVFSECCLVAALIQNDESKITKIIAARHDNILITNSPLIYLQQIALILSDTPCPSGEYLGKCLPGLLIWAIIFSNHRYLIASTPHVINYLDNNPSHCGELLVNSIYYGGDAAMVTWIQDIIVSQGYDLPIREDVVYSIIKFGNIDTLSLSLDCYTDKDKAKIIQRGLLLAVERNNFQMYNFLKLIIN